MKNVFTASAGAQHRRVGRHLLKLRRPGPIEAATTVNPRPVTTAVRSRISGGAQLSSCSIDSRYTILADTGIRARDERRAAGMSRTWRVAVIGLGHWYSAYGLARALPEYPRAELVAAAWHDPAQLDAFTIDLRRARVCRLPRAARTRARRHRPHRGAGRADSRTWRSRRRAPASTSCSASRWR